ncbi:LOW QUALITY PROTEIN: delta(14)-sterol reductase TM7SF2-like [Amphiura filiformis]|uniref:LOW QUALITY PROTEIN: delta(14)-sterol reductase TM7SF2-like n=1 Tax=Amphiura filiformis TaxID=82378 RepID=UPI003B21F71D
MYICNYSIVLRRIHGLPYFLFLPIEESAFRRRSRSRSPSRKSPSRRRSRSPGRKASPSRKISPSRKSVDIPDGTQIKMSQRKTPARTEAEGARPATRSGVQNLDAKKGAVPKTTHYEFGGPVGAFFTMFSLPLVVLYLYFTCGKDKCQVTFDPSIISLNWRDYIDVTAFEIFIGWFVFQEFLAILPVGRVVKGQPLRTGERLSYRLNGFIAIVISIALFVAMIYYNCGVTALYDKFLPLAACAMIFSLIMSVFLYVWALGAPNHALAPGGNSGNVVYDFFIGHELNPRPFVKSFDLKCFCELRPGLIGWALLDIAFLVKAWTDFPENPPYPLICVVFFQVGYVTDALIFEEAILTTMDIIYDGFGFMLVFGDLVWVPFTYSLQARYLVDHPPKDMPQYCLIPIILLAVGGYIIFRLSNSMKNNFRKNPNSEESGSYETIPTASGRRLLVSGWWGLVRKPNYLGDLMMSLSWSLFCGFDSIIPYFYPIYFLILLIHREMRDDGHCREKYGKAWDNYCKRVPYRIIPYVY